MILLRRLIKHVFIGEREHSWGKVSSSLSINKAIQVDDPATEYEGFDFSVSFKKEDLSKPIRTRRQLLTAWFISLKTKDYHKLNILRLYILNYKTDTNKICTCGEPPWKPKERTK